MRMPSALRIGLALLGALWLAGCASKKTQVPAELVKIDSQVRVERLWSTRIGKGQGKALSQLRPVIADGTVYAASVDGEIEARRLDNGRRLWLQDLKKVRLAAGVGIGPDFVLVGSQAGELMALSREDGRLLWVTELGSKLVSPPASDGQRVFVQTVDGKVMALEAGNGERLWTHDSQMPVLTQWGTGMPVLADRQLLVGLPSGKLISLEAASGLLLWEGRVAVPQGRSELDRLVDIDGDPLVSGNRVYAVSYQGNLAAFNLAAGRMEWRVPASSHVGLSEGFGNLYVVEAEGTVRAYDPGQARLRWQQDALSWRGLTAAVPLSSYLLVADRQGYVHVLSQVDGRFVGRFRVQRKGIGVAPVVADGIAVFYANNGRLAAYRIVPRR